MKTKKTKTREQKRNVKVQELVRSNTTLELFLKALTQLYPLDKLAPGIVLSHLSDGTFYAAVCRYDLKGLASPDNPGAKQTLLSVKANTMLEAILALAAAWQGKTKDAQAFVGITVRRHGKKMPS